MKRICSIFLCLSLILCVGAAPILAETEMNVGGGPEMIEGLTDAETIIGDEPIATPMWKDTKIVIPSVSTAIIFVKPSIVIDTVSNDTEIVGELILERKVLKYWVRDYSWKINTKGFLAQEFLRVAPKGYAYRVRIKAKVGRDDINLTSNGIMF